jgi:hypothetical protein
MENEHTLYFLKTWGFHLKSFKNTHFDDENFPLFLEVSVVQIFVDLELDIQRNEPDKIEADVAFVLRDLDGVHVRRSHLTQKLKGDQRAHLLKYKTIESIKYYKSLNL